MRTNLRVTCLGLMALGPLLTACGESDDAATDDASATSAASPSEAEPTGVYGQPTDPDAGEPTEVASDTPAAPTRSAAPASSGTSVAPRLTYFGWNADIRAVEAGGTVPGIVESGGRCTLTMSLGGTEVDVSSEAIDNVTSTSCAEMVIPGDRLSSGAWQAVLTYESESARGVSEAVEVQVP